MTPSDDNVRSRKYRRRGLNGCLSKETVKHQFEDYCSSSSIHGVQYMGDSRRPLYERNWWLVIFVVSFLLNGYLIYRVYAKWRDSPVIVAFSQTTTPIWEVPFPAITLCLQVNSRRHDFNMADSLQLKPDEPSEIERRAAMSLLCDEDFLVNGSSLHLDQSMIDFLVQVAPDVGDTLYSCSVRHADVDCREMFRPVFTEDGLCFTYNVLNHSAIFRDGWSVYPYPGDLPEAEYWSLDRGYTHHSPIDIHPHRGLDSGERGGINIIVSGNKSNQDSVCRGPIPGYKIILHNPAEVPFSSEKYIRVPIEQEMLVLVTPNIMTTSRSLRSYPSSVRQCFYPDERRLKYFKVYTERNCELECLTNYTLTRCGCASVYMPRDDTTPVCGGGMKECTINMAYELRTEELKKSNSGQTEDYCNCLPACTSITYHAETSQANFEWRKTVQAFKKAFPDADVDDIQPDYTLSSITLFFTDTQFTTTHRSEMFGVVDFLANCGGLLGLFSGISVLSLLEILYFSTIRYWTNVRSSNSRRTVESAQEDQGMLPQPQ